MSISVNELTRASNSPACNAHAQRAEVIRTFAGPDETRRDLLHQRTDGSMASGVRRSRPPRPRNLAVTASSTKRSH